MASDQTVTARAILVAIMDVRRRGSTAVLEELEQIEPELAEYLMENLSLLHQQLLNLNRSSKQTRRLYRDVEQLCLVSISALRKAHYELWQDAPEPPEAPEAAQ